MFNEFKPILNKKVTSVIFSPSQLIFNLEDVTVRYNAVGDCCSESFIEDLDNIEALQDATMMEVEVVDGPSKDMADGYGESKWTFYKFKTNKGMCTLSFRNDSNGYYNGWLELE